MNGSTTSSSRADSYCASNGVGMARAALIAVVIATSSLLAAENVAPVQPTALDRAFLHMYDLDFATARQEIAAWKGAHPQDPLGPAAEAAGYLFAEFDRLQILQAEFFESDQRFRNRKKALADSRVKREFDAALARAEQLSQAILARDPTRREALFAMVLANGLRADYAALIEKRDLAALGFTRTASQWAEKLLREAPDYYDAYLATGLGKYIVGTKPAPVRWLLRIAGIKGDRQAGMHELRITAERGRFLAPFARLLLAVGYLREGDRAQAHSILAQLRQQFPRNPLFAREAARLERQQRQP